MIGWRPTDGDYGALGYDQRHPRPRRQPDPQRPGPSSGAIPRARPRPRARQMHPCGGRNPPAKSRSRTHRLPHHAEPPARTPLANRSRSRRSWEEPGRPQTQRRDTRAPASPATRRRVVGLQRPRIRADAGSAADHQRRRLADAASTSTSTSPRRDLDGLADRPPEKTPWSPCPRAWWSTPPAPTASTAARRPRSTCKGKPMPAPVPRRLEDRHGRGRHPAARPPAPGLRLRRHPQRQPLRLPPGDLRRRSTTQRPGIVVKLAGQGRGRPEHRSADHAPSTRTRSCRSTDFKLNFFGGARGVAAHARDLRHLLDHL